MSKDDDFYRLWRHENGVWYIIWSGTSGTGQQSAGSRRISTRTTDRREAEQYRAQFITGLKNPTPKDEPTIGYLLDRYRNEHGVNTRSLATIDHNLKTLKPFFGDLLPNHISNSLFIDYAKQRKASAGTILRSLGILKAAIHYAEGNRWIEKQPQFIMPVKQPPPRDIWFTREQISLLIEKAKSPHIRLFIKFALSTAARSGAILDLKWEQIDFEHRIINFGRGYGNKRRAVVPMNDDIFLELIEARELSQTEYVIEYNGSPIKSVKKAFTQLCKKNGFKGSPHALRHTAATWLIMDGVPIAEAARLLGDSEKTVERVYGKHAPDYLRRAVNTLQFKRLQKPQP